MHSSNLYFLFCPHILKVTKKKQKKKTQKVIFDWASTEHFLNSVDHNLYPCGKTWCGFSIRLMTSKC